MNIAYEVSPWQLCYISVFHNPKFHLLNESIKIRLRLPKLLAKLISQIKKEIFFSTSI